MVARAVKSDLATDSDFVFGFGNYHAMYQRCELWLVYFEGVLNKGSWLKSLSGLMSFSARNSVFPA